MKTNFLITLMVLLAFSCEKEHNSTPDSISYVFSFSTEPRPITLTIDKEGGIIYVANLKPSNNDYSAKIQKFNKEGELLKTVVDFETFDKGNFLRYLPVDITIDDNRNLYVLVNPLIEQTDETWTTPTGFCILQFDFNGSFKKEFDLSQIDGEGSPSSIAYSNKHVFVTNGRIIKKISIESEQVFDILLPVSEKNINTWPDLHTTDMAINSEGIIYLTGQAAFSNDSVGCHITKFYPQNNQRITSYSKGWTGMFAAMLNNPGLSISSDGNIYLATFYVMSLEIFNKNIEFIMQLDIRTENDKETRPIDIALDNSHIYIADNKNNLILVYKEFY